MPELIEPDEHATAVLAETLARQAAALHVVFMRAFAEILSNNERSPRDVSRALKAQHQCRTAIRLLIELRAAEQSQKKIAKSNERTIGRGNFPSGPSPWKSPFRSPLVVDRNAAAKG